MLGTSSRRAVMAMALMAGLGSAALAQPAPTVTMNAPRRAKRGLFGGYTMSSAPMTYGYKGAGISMAQQQRASRKARNVKRHKARC